MARDLMAWADAATALADRASQGDWWPSLAEEGSDEYDEVMIGTDETGDLHSLAISTSYGPLSQRNVQLMAAAPALARALATVLRAVAGEHWPMERPSGTGCATCRPSRTAAVWPCSTTERILAALAPLAPLFPDTEGGGDEG